jgi:WD40 repeat protein
VREQTPSFTPPVSLPIPIPVPSTTWVNSIVVWDIKTGAIINDIVNSFEGDCRIMFSGNYTVTLITDYSKAFRAYDALNGALLYEGEILPRFDRSLGAYWEHGESLRLATSYAAGGKLAIDIHQLQSSSAPLFQIVKSFVVPPHDGKFSFSPVSFHASFVTETEITLLDVRGSEVLLRTEAPQPLYLLPGRFSPDGGFFACGTWESEIHVWKNTPAGYTPWSGLKPRLDFGSFSFSPTATSILAWGGEGVQLLDNGTRIPSPNKTASDRHDWVTWWHIPKMGRGLRPHGGAVMLSRSFALIRMPRNGS